jgi:hypothetical protein
LPDDNALKKNKKKISARESRKAGCTLAGNDSLQCVKETDARSWRRSMDQAAALGCMCGGHGSADLNNMQNYKLLGFIPRRSFLDPLYFSKKAQALL